MVRGDEIKTFFSYDGNKNNVPYCTSKLRVMTVFIGTAFKRHTVEIISKLHDEPFLELFFYLPSTADQIGKVNQYMENVTLSPIDCR